MNAKSTPRVADGDVQKALEQVYRDLNEIIALLNKGQTGTPKQSEGDTGAVRVVKVGNNDVRMVAKSDTGWHEVAMTLQKKAE
jgi:hypothetical protein